MIDHARFRELAAAAVDFDLDETERTELDSHLAGCDACRAYAAALAVDADGLGTLPQIDTPERVRRAVAAGRRRSAWPAAAPLAAVLTIAVLTILPLGLGAMIFGGFGFCIGCSSGAGTGPTIVPGTGAPPSAVAAPTQAPAASAAPSASASEVPSSAVWNRSAAAPAGSEAASLRAVARRSDGPWVAVGAACASAPSASPCGPVIFTSDDAEEWVRQPRDPALDVPNPPTGWQPGMRDIAATDDGYVAVGAAGADDGTRAVAWRSADGRDWVLAPPDGTLAGGWMNAIISLDAGGFLAVGATAADDRVRAAAWRSNDGVAWTRAIDVASSMFDVGVSGPIHDGRPTSGLMDVVEGPHGLVAVGATCEKDSRCIGVSWAGIRTGDGITWTRNEGFGGSLRVAVAARDDGALVAVGYGAGPAISLSTDGRDWVAADIGPSSDSIEFVGVVANADSFVAGGVAGGGGPSVWGSAVGNRWLPEGVDAFAGDSVFGFGAHEAEVVAVGPQNAADAPPAIWLRQPVKEGSP